MEEDWEDSPPFWLQSTANLRRADLYRHRVSSIFFNSGVLVILLLVTAVCLMVFVIPSLLSLSAQIFRPNTVKKSWDSINVVLVLFALLFAFLSRNRNGDSGSDEYHRPTSNITNGAPKSNQSTPRQWYDDYSDRTPFNYSSSTTAIGGLRRRRSSYPDVREASPWLDGDDRWRSFDDTQIYRVSDTDHLRRSWREVDTQDSETKNIIVDTFATRPEIIPDTPPPPLSPPPPVPLSPPPPPPPPPPAVKKKTRRTYQSIAHEEKPPTPSTAPPPRPLPPSPSSPPQPSAPPPAFKKKRNRSYQNILLEEETPTPPTAPPPPSPPPATQGPMDYWEPKSSGSDKKRGGANATKDFLTSLYHKKKKKKQRQKSVDNLDALLHRSEPPPLHYSPPPPPPPPPPPSVFHNLFSSKKGKRKLIPSPPPPPPPPPSTTARGSKATARVASVAVHKSVLPVKTRSFNSGEENPSSGGESPLNRIPPPPPPPPFKMPDWKFVVQGDYVRVQSSHSSRSGSPDLDDVESSPTKASSESHGTTTTTTVMDGGDATSSPLFCPSPDVDTKADSFIARFRAGLRLEKIDSFNQKQGLRMSNLGPGPGPSQT